MKNTEQKEIKVIRSFAVSPTIWSQSINKVKRHNAELGEGEKKLSLSSVLTYALREYLGL